jgi:hypothetical protein
MFWRKRPKGPDQPLPSIVQRAPAAGVKAPVVVMSFNRPHYLAPVLDSLAAQTALNGRAVYLLQDNAISPYSGKRFALDEDIAACMEVFRQRFPDGTALLADHNLGIARNFLRAEELVFSHLGQDVGYFFEDDMVLSPHYLAMMDQIYSYVEKTPRIGYFAAYGALAMPLHRQRARAHDMKRFSFNWAFGLTRRHWLDLRNWLEPYYQLSAGLDYKERRSREIANHYRGQGAPLISADQDVMKQLGTNQLGRVSICTVACFGRYIGEQGVHFHPERYQREGFGHTELYPEPVELKFPTDEVLDRFYAEESRNRRQRFQARADRKAKSARAETA